MWRHCDTTLGFAKSDYYLMITIKNPQAERSCYTMLHSVIRISEMSKTKLEHGERPYKLVLQGDGRR